MNKFYAGIISLLYHLQIFNELNVNFDRRRLGHKQKIKGVVERVLINI